METWNNGDSGLVVKRIIENNFKILDDRITQSTGRYELNFDIQDWNSGEIFIPYTMYKKTNPCVDLYIKNNTSYSIVYNGFIIEDAGITLQSDLAYKGKVVVR